MRLPVDAGFRLLTLGLTATLAGCGLVGGGGGVESIADARPLAPPPGAGPAADYPVVLGDPFTVEGQLYTPADTMNYDSVGYAMIEQGAGVTASHRTLPLPSYVEVTSLESGKTVLVRVERRGPMTGQALVALSPAAAAQLGAGEGAPVRVRRVNPVEVERAELRAGRPAPDRIETPKSLVEVLRRKLPASGAASLRGAVPQAPGLATNAAVVRRPAPMPTVSRSAELPPVHTAPADAQQAVTAYPLPPLAGSQGAVRPVVVARAEPAPVPVQYTMPGQRQAIGSARAAPVSPAADPSVQSQPVSGDGFVVQAGAFSNRASAQRVAQALGGYVSPAGSLFRVRTGPFASRGQAEAALAKVRAAGYSDARVYTAG